MKNTELIIIGGAALLAAGAFLYWPQKASISFNSNSKWGTIDLGKKSESFGAGTGAMVSNGRGYEMTVSYDTANNMINYTFMRFGKNIASGSVNGVIPGSAGNSFVAINIT